MTPTDELEWTERFNSKDIQDKINEKLIMFCDIAAQGSGEYDCIQIFKINKIENELVYSRNLPTNMSYEERQKQFNSEVDELALKYDVLDVIKDGKFTEESEFEKSKQRQRGINIVMAGRDFGKDRTMRHLLKTMYENPNTPIMIASTGSVGKTCSAKWFPEASIDDVNIETTLNDKSRVKNFLNESLGDFKIQENFEQPKSKYHK